MTVNLSALAGAGQQFFTNSGTPLTGGKLYSYAAGTTTPQACYTSASGVTPHANPIILDSSGRVATGEIWLTAGNNYKFVLTDSAGASIATWDNITGINGTGITVNAINVQYDPAGTGAVSTTVQAKLRQTVSVMDFGAVGNGVVDDTAAVQAAINYAKSIRGAVYFPVGTYRVTSGYTQSVNYADVRLYGASFTREGAGGSCIKLDSTDPNSFFFETTARQNLVVENLVFTCAQFVQDRGFFKFGSTTYQEFNNVNFESVEKPIVFTAGSYFQSASYQNVQFRSSGTFHSESTTLLGTLLVLNNVNHEGVVPANTEKVVCNLRGIRYVSGTNVLLEGALPSANWTVLNFDCGASSPGITTESVGCFQTYWSEWSGPNQPSVDVNLNGMSITFISPHFSDGKLQLNNNSFLTIDNWIRFSDDSSVASQFTFVDTQSRAIVDKSQIRNSSLSSSLSTQLIIKNSSLTISGAANDASRAMPFSTQQSEVLYKWDGGIPRTTSRVDPKGDNVYSALRSIETNATYGRIQRINRNGQSYGLPSWKVFVTPEMVGKPLSLALLANFPNINGGTYIIMYANWDGGTWGGSAATGTIMTGSYLWQQFTINVPTSATYVEFSVGTNSGVVASDTLIAAVRIICGQDMMPYPLPAYPAQTVSFADASPTTGTWAVGDRVVNSVPAVGSPKGWACTVAGSPGTWVSEGNL